MFTKSILTKSITDARFPEPSLICAEAPGSENHKQPPPEAPYKPYPKQAPVPGELPYKPYAKKPIEPDEPAYEPYRGI